MAYANSGSMILLPTNLEMFSRWVHGTSRGHFYVEHTEVAPRGSSWVVSSTRGEIKVFNHRVGVEVKIRLPDGRAVLVNEHCKVYIVCDDDGTKWSCVVVCEALESDTPG